MPRTLIKGGTVISMDGPDLPKGDVLIEDSRIAQVGREIAAPDAAVIDASGMIVAPGFINAHVHTWQSALRGIAGDWTIAKYMQAMHRGLATYYKPEDIRIANLVGALNQLNCGATTLVDWCHNNPTPEHTEAAIAGLDEAGARAVFLHGSPKPNPKPGQKHFSEIPMPRSEIERFCKGRFASRDGLVTFGLAILGPYYSIYEVTRTDFELAREFDLLTSMHVGGGKPVVADGFERLLAEDLVTSKINIVHGNDIAPATVSKLAAAGATFTITAEVELQMGFGDPLTGQLHEMKSPVSIGTDIESSVSTDLFTAMRVTLQHQRNRSITETLNEKGARPEEMPMTCRDALAWITVNAARMAGLDHRIGTITPGKEADLVLIRASDLNMWPVRDPVGSLVLQAGIANVDTVLVAGRVVKRGGKLLHPGLDAKLDALKRSGDRILSDIGMLPAQAA